MKLQGAIALVTGSNQGIGRGLVEVLLERGAAKVYATARRPETLAAICALDAARVVPLKLDIVIESDRRAAPAIVCWMCSTVHLACFQGSAS